MKHVIKIGGRSCLSIYLETFPGSKMEGVVVSFCIEEHSEAVSFAHLRPSQNVVILLEQFSPERQVVERLVKAKLRLNDGTDADIGAKVGVEIGGSAIFGFATVACFQNHCTTRFLFEDSKNKETFLEECCMGVVNFSK